jgi:digeranylgeranylglycerophospholipid reductase
VFCKETFIREEGQVAAMDIIIAGAGITGCYMGQLLKSKGFNPVLFEEHPEVGQPVQCAGLIGRELVETSKLPFPRRTILRQVDGARFFLKNDWFEIERTKAAYVIDRAELDKYFSQGLDIHSREKVKTFTEDDTIQVTTTRKSYTCEVLFGCDGPFSAIRKAGTFSLKTAFYPGAQYIIQKTPEDDFLELHVKPPFFFWVIPETEETTRIGFVGPDPLHELNRFIQRKEIRGEILDKHAGIIPVGYGSIAAERVALVGDAACQVKPLTGGGIFYGMKAAEIAVEYLDDLLKYEKEWKRQFGREIKAGLRMRKIYESMSEKTLERIFRIFKENTDMIEDIADFDRHTSVLSEFLKHPVLLKLAGSALKEFLR